MLRSGITTVCDVSASGELIKSSKQLEIISSGGMAMGIVINSKGYVEQASASGAKYIKVLLLNAYSIGKPALCGIVKAAHKRELKVAVHATEIAPGQPATMLLLDGRPDRRITDSSKIRNIWVKGEVFR